MILTQLEMRIFDNAEDVAKRIFHGGDLDSFADVLNAVRERCA